MPVRTYDAWLATIDEHTRASRLERSVYGVVHGPRGAYPLVRFRSRNTAYRRPTLLITAGFHGDEPEGPDTLAAPLLLSLTEVLASGEDVALDVFPCVNPTGYEARTRYNIRGERPNNDCLRYELIDGSEAGELPSPATPFRSWRPLMSATAEETRALMAALEASAPHDAALDLHQDPSVRGPGTYAYHLGPRGPLRVAQEAAGAVLPLLRDTPVWGARTDAEGFIEAHDGSVTDYAFRRGARHAVCVETTTDSRRSIVVFDVWISAMIALAAGREREPRHLATLTSGFTRGLC